MDTRDISEKFYSDGGLQEPLTILMLFLIVSRLSEVNVGLDVSDVYNEKIAEPTTEDFSYPRHINPDIRSAFLNGCS